MIRRYRRVALSFITLLVTLGSAAAAPADNEARFRSFCEEDAATEKCSCYLDRLKESLSASDYQTLIAYEVAESERLRSQRKLVGSRGPSEEDILAMRRKTQWAIDEGLTACELNYHE